MSCCSISSRLSLWISKGATCSRKKWQDQITFKILRFLFYFFIFLGVGGGGVQQGYQKDIQELERKMMRMMNR